MLRDLMTSGKPIKIRLPRKPFDVLKSCHKILKRSSGQVSLYTWNCCLMWKTKNRFGVAPKILDLIDKLLIPRRFDIEKYWNRVSDRKRYHGIGDADAAALSGAVCLRGGFEITWLIESRQCPKTESHNFDIALMPEVKRHKLLIEKSTVWNLCAYPVVN